MAEWTQAEDGKLLLTTEDGKDYRVFLKDTLGNGEELWEAQTRGERDWWSIYGSHRTAEAAKADCVEHAQHVRELAALERTSRYFEEGKGTTTPWGKAQHAVTYARGVISYSTAGHGGFRVSPTLNATAPDHLRNDDGWYEEDCEWAKVALAFPELFTARERRMADDSVRNWYPDAWEAHHGRVLAVGESRAKDERLFKERHRNDLVVVSAIRCDDDRTMVKVTATVGGDRRSFDDAREFLVPAAEYEKRGRFGFVIDESRHEELARPGMRP